MKIPFRSAALLISATLFFPSLVNGQIRSLNIDGPLELASGQLVRLAAELQPNETPFWIVLSPVELDYEQVENGRRLIFSIGCDQRSDVIVVLLAQSVVDQQIITRQLRRRIQILETPPSQPPPVPVQPPPALVPTDPPNELPMFSVVQQAWTQIRSTEAQAKSAEIADHFSTVAMQCQAGELTEIPQIWSTLSRRNSQSLGIYAADWEPLGLAVQIEFKRLRLSTVREHASQLLAAAAAIRQSMKQNIQGIIR